MTAVFAPVERPARATRYLTAAELALAERLLRDGASCSEVARTIGVATKSISRRWPERRWTQRDGALYGNLNRLTVKRIQS